MAEHISFSHLVDEVMARSHRPPLPGNIDDVSSYVNSTIIQITNTGLYKRDLVEDEVVVSGAQGHYVWARPRNFRQMQAVRYNVIGPDGFIYPLRREPGSDLRDAGEYYYYYAGDTVVFNGVGSGTKISLAYYTRPRRLPYRASGERLAYYDLVEDDWVYPVGVSGDYTDEEKRNASANWAILDWYELVAEGAVTKYFNKLGDERAKSTYAVFKELIQDVPRTEILGHTEFMQLPVNAGDVLQQPSTGG